MGKRLGPRTMRPEVVFCSVCHAQLAGRLGFPACWPVTSRLALYGLLHTKMHLIVARVVLA